MKFEGQLAGLLVINFHFGRRGWLRNDLLLRDAIDLTQYVPAMRIFGFLYMPVLDLLKRRPRRCRVRSCRACLRRFPPVLFFGA